MRYLIIGLVFMLSACSNSETLPDEASTTASKSAAPKSEQGIPENAKEYIKANFPGWSIPARGDYKIWWSFHDARSEPYCAIADINDDQNVDYAFILKNQSALKVLILLGNGTSFKHWTDDNFTGTIDPKAGDLLYGLTVETPRKVDVVYPEISSLILKSNAFNLMELENRRFIYHWVDGNVAAFETR